MSRYKKDYLGQLANKYFAEGYELCIKLMQKQIC